jgi:UDP-N-acetylmuramoyl-tripeptide--D-alanyl-D-alanine ligase
VTAGATPPGEVTGVTLDSRAVSKGDLFLALRGPHADGHAFVEDAVTRGAALAVIADPRAARGPSIVVDDTLRALGAIAALHRRSQRATVIGITGSVGKTTTVGLCAEVLAQRYETLRSAPSWNAEIGVALTLLGLEPSHDVAVIEMAMRGIGQLRELVEMASPRIGAVTNIADTHLELLGSRDQIAAAKAELLEGLPADGVAIVNADEALTERLLRDVRCPVVTVGVTHPADVRATEITRINGGYAFHLRVRDDETTVHLPLPGVHQVRNALVAAAVGHAMGLTVAQIRDGLASAHPIKMRQHVLMVGDIMLIDDSYNASPQSMLATFDVLAQVGGRRRRVLALGEMRELGPQSRDFHRRVGREAAALAPAFLLGVGPNGGWYLEGAVDAGLPVASTAAVTTVDEAVRVLRRILRAGDVVLVKGSRAIEMEHVVQALRDGHPVGQP